MVWRTVAPCTAYHLQGLPPALEDHLAYDGSLFKVQCSMLKSSTFLNKYPQTLSSQYDSIEFALTKNPHDTRHSIEIYLDVLSSYYEGT